LSLRDSHSTGTKNRRVRERFLSKLQADKSSVVCVKVEDRRFRAGN
jgi:hypothetical protein